MGFIERLNGSNDPNSVLGRAFALREGRRRDDDEDVSRDTLAPDIPSPTTATPAAVVDPGAAIRALLKEFHVHHAYGITTPSHLFSLLHRHLAVKRGALLVPAPEGEHLPLATAGLDRTSTFRLRLTDAELAEMVRKEQVTILGGDDRLIFEDRLSRSDFRRSPRLALFPFFHIQRLLATLIVFESPVLDFDPAVLDVILGALAENAGRLLFDGRQRPLGHRSRSVVLPPSQATAAIQRLEARFSRSGRNVEILDVDLTAVAKLVEAVHPHLDHKRLVDDLLDTTAMLVSASHDVIHLGGGQVLLIGSQPQTCDAGLLIHLVGTTLTQLFGVGSRPVLEYRERAKAEFERAP